MELTLTYTNPLGKSATFRSRRNADGSHPPYLLNYVTGAGGPAAEYDDMPLTGSDGSVLGDTRFPARTVQTGCMVHGKTAEERDARLRALIGILNPKLGNGIITYTNHEGVYTAAARCILLPSFGANTRVYDFKPVLIDYLCPHPYWQGAGAHSALVAASSAAFMLPFTLPFKLGLQSYKATAVNASSVPVPVKIIIYGPSVNPVITNDTTGEMVRVRRPVETGERLIIETGPSISVKIINSQGVESDALNYVNLLSTDWIQLAPGPNELTYSSDDAAKSTRIEAHWNDWYAGVG